MIKIYIYTYISFYNFAGKLTVCFKKMYLNKKKLYNAKNLSGVKDFSFQHDSISLVKREIANYYWVLTLPFFIINYVLYFKAKLQTISYFGTILAGNVSKPYIQQ